MTVTIKPNPYGTKGREPSSARVLTPIEETKRAIFLVNLPLFFNGFYNPILNDIPPLFWAIDILTWTILPTWLCYRMVRVDAIEFSTIFSLKNPRRLLWLSAATGICLPAICKGSDWLLRFLLPDYLRFPLFSFYYTQTLPPTGALRFLMAFYYSTTAGWWEELFFRVFPFSLFQVRWKYILFTSLLFAIDHFEQNLRGLITVFLFGIATSIFYARFRLVLPLMFGHFCADFLLFYFDV